jgi:peptidoglycan/LPS O-acetylase OafA/YrhL
VGNVLANIFLLQSWSPKGTDASIVVPAWCLSVEAFFYLVLPLGMVRFSRLCNRSPAAAFHLIVAACLLTAALITAKLCPATFPPAYLPVFAFGGYLATNQPKAVHVSTAAVLSVLGVIVYGLIIVLLPGTSFPAFTTTAVPFALLVHALAERDAQVARAPSRRVGVLSCDLAVRLGSWSYAFFLLHSLVIFVSDALVSTPPPRGGSRAHPSRRQSPGGDRCGGVRLSIPGGALPALAGRPAGPVERTETR